MNTNTKMDIENNSCLLVCLGGKKYIPCETFSDCSEAIKDHITVNYFGASDFYKKKNIGVILHPIKGHIAHVSYNGRVWEESGIEITNLSAKDI